MKEIDWSKAPEGAIGFAMSTQAWENPIWYKKNDSGDLVFTLAGKPEAWQVSCLVPDHVVWRDDCERWTGAGLPPVGTVCEVEDEDGNWHECRILAHYLGDAVFCPDPDYPYGAYDGLPEGRFRPLRTPEQIAAEEREKAINAMEPVAAAAWRATETGGDMIADICAALHDHGYRRQEPSE